MELYGFSGVWGGGVVQIVLGGLSGGRNWYRREVWAPGGFGRPGELRRVSLSPRRLATLRISDMKP